MCRSCQVLRLVTWVSATIRVGVCVCVRVRWGKGSKGWDCFQDPIVVFQQSPAHTLLMLWAIHVSFIIDNPACTCNVYHTHYKEVSHSLAVCVYMSGWVGVTLDPNCKSAISFTLQPETWDHSHSHSKHKWSNNPTLIPPHHTHAFPSFSSVHVS